MKKITLTFAVAIGLVANGTAASGWFSDYVLVSINGSAAGYYWIGTDPGFGTSFNGANFGSVNSLTFGADMKYWDDSVGGRTGGSLWVSIDGGTFTESIWTQTYLGGNDYQGSLAVSTIDVRGNLANGAHTVSVYAKNWGPGGDNYLSNNGNNYTASFTVIPEPSTYALLALSAAGFSGYVVRRRRR